MGASEIEIKGVAVRSLLQVLADEHGDGFTTELSAVVEEPFREALGGPILAATWYPIGLYRAIHQGTQTRLHAGPELSKALARRAVSRDFTGVYRMLAGTLKPEWLMSWSPRQYRRYFRGGQATVPEARAGYSRFALRGCHGFDRSLWMDMAGSCEAILEACGATHVRSRLASGGDGPDGDLEFFWL